MRHPMKPAMRPAALVAVLLAAAPAAAQGTGPAWHDDAAIPAPGMPPATVSPGVPTAGPRVWQNGRWMALPPHGPRPGPQEMPDRWGATIDGRWHAGARAPGGWKAYRPMRRGHRLPGYWMAGAFRIPDYLAFGLAAPPPGYFWVRYYDDAVLVDAGGEVWDSVGGVAWAGAAASAGGSWSDSYSYSSAGAGYRQPIVPVDPNAYYDPYPGGYAPPAGPVPPAVQFQGGYQASGSYQAGAWHYGVPTGATVVIALPATTTTTTTVIEEEVIEETVTTTSYVRAAPKRVVRRAPARKKYRPKPVARCCVCVVCR